ncbi:MAG: cation-translocating P-type ATPase, partial [Caldisericaceae bacterium]
VLGDLVVLEAGDKISCDGTILEERALNIDESTLTGESVSVKKVKAAPNEEATEENCVFMGTAVTKGRGKVWVTAVGINTKLGQIASKIREVKKDKTPLEIQLDALGRLLGIIFLLISLFIFVLGALRGNQITEMLLTSISLAVAAIPEGLPAVVTIVLAIGVAEMAKRKAVIRNLPAVETLGAVTHICTDKTGTLTQNKMTLVGVWSDERYLTGSHIRKEVIKEEIIRGMVLCNDATLSSGDPTEIALISFMERDFIEKLRATFPRISEIPFTSETKRMTTIHKAYEKNLVISKGAIEIILSLSNRELINGKVEELSQSRKNQILKISEDFAAKGLRILGFAENTLDGTINLSEAELEKNLIFLGFVVLKDPLRPEVKEAVDLCRSAGIRPVMITGDHPVTAYSISMELDFPEGRVVTSSDMQSIDDDALSMIVDDVSVFARINPLDKLRIVEALQKNGEVVAMTGDGVNDAPALKKSDIGVSMGKTGTEVAKEASDMVLMDDNFATLVDAVYQGRTIYENMRKFVVYLLSCNIGEVLVMFTAIIIGYPVPLLPLQLLWLNLVTDSFPALALGMEKGEPHIMHSKPRGKKEPLLNRYHAGIIVTQSVAITLATLAGFLIGLKRTGDVNEARTIAYMVLVLSELFRAFSARSFEGYVFRIGIFSNKFLTYSTIAGILLLLLTIYIKPVQILFRNVQPTGSEFLYIILLSLVPFAISEFSKIIRKDEEGR